MKLKEKTLQKNIVFTGRIIQVRQDIVELENGRTALRDVVEHPGGVCVLPLTEAGEVVMVRQFRYPYGEVLLELPAGKLDKGGEDSLSCGMRELREETGLTAGRYTALGQMYPTPGYCDEVIHLYLAQDLQAGEQDLDDDEFLSVVRYPFSTIYQMVLEGEIRDAKTQIAILKAAALLNK